MCQNVQKLTNKRTEEKRNSPPGLSLSFEIKKQKSDGLESDFRLLTYFCYIQAVHLGGVVPAGGDSGHIHTVDLPYRCVTAVEVAAVGAVRHIVWTLVFGPLTAHTEEKISSLTLQVFTHYSHFHVGQWVKTCSQCRRCYTAVLRGISPRMEPTGGRLIRGSAY